MLKLFIHRHEFGTGLFTLNVLYIILKKLIIIFLTFNHVNLFLVTYFSRFLFSRKNEGEMTNYHKSNVETISGEVVTFTNKTDVRYYLNVLRPIVSIFKQIL